MATITVLMPVYNAEKYLEQAIESILNQTFSDFELLAIDDASSDNSLDILQAVTDSRLRIIRNETNLGVARTLNKGLDIASCDYIARMDADDICEPFRLQKQFNYLEEHQDVGIVGSWVRYFGNGQNYILRYPVGSDCIKSFILFSNPLAHPSLMIRKKVFDENSLRYDESCIAAQDYELWSRCNEVLRIENIPLPLVRWRANDEGVTLGSFEKSNSQTLLVLKKELKKLGINISSDQLLFHREVGNGSGFSNLVKIKEAQAWLKNIIRINDEMNVFPREGLRQAAGFVWFKICLNSSGLGVEVLKLYFSSFFRSFYRPGLKEVFQLVINGLIRIRKQSVGQVGG